MPATKTPNTRNIRNMLARAGLTADKGVTVKRGNGVEITVVAVHEWDENDQYLTRGALDAQGRIRRVDSEATDALEEQVQAALVAGGYGRFGGFSTGWDAWILQSNYVDPNPHNLQGLADPMHY